MECSIITVACRRRRPKKTKIARPSAWSWALFWTGLVWWEGLVYVNGRVRESEMRGKKVTSCLLALSFLPCVLHFPCPSPSPPSLSPFLFTIPPISSAGSIERSIGRLPELSPRPSRLCLASIAASQSQSQVRLASSSISPNRSDPSMGRLLLVSLPATGAVIYSCRHCYMPSPTEPTSSPGLLSIHI